MFVCVEAWGSICRSDCLCIYVFAYLRVYVCVFCCCFVVAFFFFFFSVCVSVFKVKQKRCASAPPLFLSIAKRWSLFIVSNCLTSTKTLLIIISVIVCFDHFPVTL